jgi:hypothetical protein
MTLFAQIHEALPAPANLLPNGNFATCDFTGRTGNIAPILDAALGCDGDE